MTAAAPMTGDPAPATSASPAETLPAESDFVGTVPGRPDTAPGRSADRIAVAVLVVAALAWVGLLLTHIPLEVTGRMPNPETLHAGHHGLTPPQTPRIEPVQGSGSMPRSDQAAADAAVHAAAHAPGHTTAHAAGHGTLGWGLMVVAMMLPPALPLWRVIARLDSGVRRSGSRSRPSPQRSRPRSLFVLPSLPVLSMIAFVAVWCAAGVVLLGGDALVRAVSESVAWLGEHPQVPAGMAVLFAGAYQFSSAKHACLTACRSPVALVMTSWTGRRPPWSEAAIIGTRYGFVCVGCCWALMLVTVAVGAFALPLMVVMAVVMTAERLLPRTRVFVPLVGAACLALGAAILAGIVPSALAA